jgi:hypothetical protein
MATLHIVARQLCLINPSARHIVGSCLILLSSIIQRFALCVVFC